MSVDLTRLTRLDGKAALVTGASRGIGLAIAETLLAAGAAVCLNARKPEPLKAALQRLETQGRVAGVAGSAADEDTARSAVSRCLDDVGRLDILVNCAATNPQHGPLAEADPGAVAKVWQVNQEGPLRCTRLAWTAWMADHGGTILNLASLGGLQVTPMIGAYNVSKAALLHLTRQLALELAPKVRVNAIAPAVVKTDFAKIFWENGDEALASQYPLERLGTPEDVAAAALFLVSDAASWITGQVLILDGGVSLSPRGILDPVGGG
jgi:NAD(P)-dependent dehydrogenase (short-subunit alcohol dehydrogenase family)